MALIVQKYGGTSVANCDRIKKVADRVIATKKADNDVIVVLSAMVGKTDELIGLAKEVQPRPNPREFDSLMATGEQVTVSLFAMAAEEKGFPSRSFLGFQVPIKTDSIHTKARIKDIPSEKLKQALDEGKIVVVAGFQGVTENGDVTTLGRGGSDTSAVALAAAMGADVCEIYTDVDGVFTTDPNMCASARKIERISYEEMMEMASLGAKVLEIRSVEIAMRYNMPIHVRNSYNDREGTLVVKEDEYMEKIMVSAVAYNRNESRITISKVPDKPGIAAAIFKPVSGANINVDMIIQNVRENDITDLTFTVPRNDFEQAMEILERVSNEIGAEKVVGEKNIVKVSIIGAGMRTHSGVASRMFEILAKHGINILMISTSEIKVSCVIQEKYTELAVRALHEGFGLEQSSQ
jgi:aspartate kinase